ncbi:hypothetical protein AB6N23_01500 [Cellulomonas sp. 179-A 9B4 NHS]|uniref:hypothetical protein n=1 Tax=Cellulomonas sp. 179-A 9B4 NHS TaxID=3142379 RepID=UPI0039A10E8E
METTPLTRTSVRWRAVLCLAATVLLWPLVGTTGRDGPVLAVLVLGVTAAVWVAVLGLLDVPRPLATGTWAGLLYGAALVAVSVLVGGRGAGQGVVLVAVGALWELTWATLLGAGAGLLGRAVRQLRTGGRP